MYDTATHVSMVKARIRQKRRARERRGIIGLSALCAAVLLVLTGATGILSGIRPAARPGLSGSMLLLEHAGGYVLVGVISFTAAVVLTVLCIHIRERRKRREETKGGEEG